MEANRIRYRGQEVTLKSGTDRFVLPPDFRKQVRLSSQGDRIVCLYPHRTLPCLVGYGFSREAEFEAQLEREFELGKVADLEELERRRSQFFGAMTFAFDDSGRFVLPATFMRHARIEDALYFHGAGPEFMVFSPEEALKLDGDWAHIRMGCESAMERVKSGRGGK